MKAIMTKSEYEKSVDTRLLSNGKRRMRFRLSTSAKSKVEMAMEAVKSPPTFCTKGSQLDIIALDFMSGSKYKIDVPCASQGPERLLVRLFPDQYQLVRMALDLGREIADTDADSLVLMAETFLLNNPSEI